LVKAGENLGTRAAEQLQDQGWDLASKLWARLGSKVEARPAAQEAAKDVAAAPSDEDARAAFRVQLRKLLADDPELQQELTALLKAAPSSSVTNVNVSGDRSVGIGRDMRGGTIITGDQNRPGG